MKNWPEPFNLVVCGVGGQGNILISRIIGRILTAQGYTVSIGETFGAAQRGGSVFSSLRISEERLYGPLIPEGQANVILSLEPMEALRQMKFLGNPQVRVLSNTKIVQPADVLTGKVTYPGIDKLKSAIAHLSKHAWFVPATDIALDLGSAIVTNIVMLGALVGSKTMPISLKQAEDEVRATIPDAQIELNLEALNRGYQTTLGADAA
ncbi:MAG: indolepyruvate oxidoreductase subunit beta [Desulfobacterales bacterium]|nr:MAG: indolepyruvate oxidoreductase subunit beta [Desulfobacterales bacterium]